MPWKNGGGETTEIAVSPAGAGLENFDWRVSMARVEVDGPFSLFAGIDRTLAVLEGQGIALEIDGRPPLTLTVDSAPLRFPADVATAATLVDGPITDLNLMSRRGRMAHAMARLVVHEPVELATAKGTTLILCQSGEVRIMAGRQAGRLGSFDACVIEQSGVSIALEAETQAVVLKMSLIEITPATP